MGGQTVPNVRQLIGIFDLSHGRCGSYATLKGEGIQCELAQEHRGWAHMSWEHDLLWEATQRPAYTGIRGGSDHVFGPSAPSQSTDPTYTRGD